MKTDLQKHLDEGRVNRLQTIWNGNTYIIGLVNNPAGGYIVRCYDMKEMEVFKGVCFTSIEDVRAVLRDRAIEQARMYVRQGVAA